ncbi:MAG: hypothetical protein ATN33_00435 [Epulopiscium sp. Nele67-Bin001]|nr:MAG: hypothetical protein ATN33_00435 [Epulopiscium sp. Nele67-Bin001]
MNRLILSLIISGSLTSSPALFTQESFTPALLTQDIQLNSVIATDLSTELSIVGTAQVNKILSASVDGVSPDLLTYTWYRDGTEITSGSSYMLTEADADTTITVATDGLNASVNVDKMAVCGSVTITNTDNELSANVTNVTPTAAQTGGSYQWIVDNNAVTTTSSAYVIKDTDNVITAVYTPDDKFSGTIENTIEVGKTILQGEVSISSNDSIISASPNLSTDATYTTVWLRDNVVVSEGHEFYTISNDDLGCVITMQVVGSGNYTGTILSSNSIYVEPLAPVVTATAVSGNSQVRLNLTAQANGAPIIGYTIIVNDTEVFYTNQSSVLIENLVNNVTYTFKVQAQNAAGISNEVTASATPTLSTASSSNIYYDYYYSPVNLTQGLTTSTGISSDSDDIDEDADIEADETNDIDNDATNNIVANSDSDPSYDIGVAQTFSDVGVNEWYYDDVALMYSYGLMGSKDDDKFYPTVNCSRAMVAAVFHRMENSIEAPFVSEFVDVHENAWYAEPISWGASAGVFSGFDDGSFRPSDNITREQLVCAIYDYALYKGLTLNGITGLKSGTTFADADLVSTWAVSAFSWAISNDIIVGKDDNLLDPQGSVSRAEAATIFARFIDAF